MRSIRKRLGLSQAEAANLLDISRDYVGLIERGVKSPSPKLERKIRELGAVREPEAAYCSNGSGNFAPKSQHRAPLKYVSYTALESALESAVAQRDFTAAAEISAELATRTEGDSR